MLSLVIGRAMLPDIPGRVDVAGPDPANLTGSATGQELEADHVGDDWRKVWQCGVNGGVHDWGNRVGLAGLAPAPF